MKAKELLALVESGPASEDVVRDRLDGVVHDLKSQEASATNNEGFEAQVEFILTFLGEKHAEEEIRKAIKWP